MFLFVVKLNNTDKMRYKLIFFTILLSVLYSCNTRTFIKYYTTTKDGKFPKFNKREHLAGSNNKYRSCYDVTYYDLNIDIDPDNKYIKGSMGIHFNTLQNCDTLLLDLHKAFKIEKITLDGLSLRWKRKGNLLFLIFDRKIEIESSKVLTIYYEGNPPELLDHGPIRWKKDSTGNHWISTITQGIGEHWIIPCKSLLNDECDSLRMNITVPKGLIAVGNGRLINRKIVGNKESFEWLALNPINVYNISFNIGNFKHFEIPYTNNSGTHQLQFYVLPYHYNKAQDYMKQCVDILAFYESIYDEYPWWNDEFKIIEASYVLGGGMEHQSAITVGLTYRNFYFDYSKLLIHEIAHEWWGNSVSANDYGDLWLHEGFAVFSEMLFMEHKYGEYQYNHFNKNFKKSIYNKRPIAKPLNVKYNPFVSSKDHDIYKKGALVLHMLRFSIDNDSLFFDILKSFYLKFERNYIETNDFITHVNNKTNEDYTWLFDQYVYDYTIPELHYFEKLSQNNSIQKTTFYYKWMNVSDEFKLPVNIIANTDTIKLYPGLEYNSIEFMDIDSIYFDINNGCFDLVEEFSNSKK